MDGEDGERRSSYRLTNEQEKIAQRAAELVWRNFQLEVGKLTVRSFLYVVLAGVVAVLGWLGLHGKLG